MSSSGKRMGARCQQPGTPAGARVRILGSPEWPGGRPGKGSSAKGALQRWRLALWLHAWLWAVSGASAQVFKLSLRVDEGLPPDTLVGDIRAGLPAAQQLEGGGFFLSEDSDDSPLLDDFHVHPDTGIIRTARRLDRERRDRYSFVAATLLGAVVQVEIRVTDVNDHAPSFPRDSLQLDVSELSPPGTAFRLPGAQDPDAGLFSTQGYTLLHAPDVPEDPAGPFFQLRYGSLGSPPASSLEPLDLVLLRRLDREQQATHELQIEAWDGGHPRLTGHLRVELRVLDENDNPPVFEQAEYRASVREDAPPGAEVCRVRATDRDQGANGEVRYGLRARQAPPGDAASFSVDELSGVVRVHQPLDREAQAWHQLVIEARDAGAEPEVATVRVSIAVLDVNDNQPAIHLLFLTEGGVARVSEGARPGDYVARVSVSDADGDPVVSASDSDSNSEAFWDFGVDRAGGSIALTLEGGDGTFSLRSGSSPEVFFLCVEGPLDRESRDLYDLRLVATDAGSPPLSTEETLLLRVSDLNDQAPVFSQAHYRGSVSEAAAPGTPVLWVSASDADEAGTDHSRLRYELLHLEARCGSEAECGASFAIDPDRGVIGTLRSLDREAQDRVELRVVVRDLGEPPLTATCLVSITVEDVNDNEPIFPRQVYNVTLVEHTAVGHCFLQVKASDADTGLYGFIEYSLYDGFQSSAAPQAFQIDLHDGRICVSQDIDRERDPATYDLLVKAKDGGGLSAQAFVRVEVEDVNDNEPVFNPSTYGTSISGQTQSGTEIINVFATDRDSGIYGTVTYELIPGDLSSLFTIDSATGIIYLASSISHLESTTLWLMVCARDGGGLTSVVNAQITVQILQTTLAPADFERPKYTFSVYEDVPKDSPVGTVKAKESLNSSEPILYKISSGDLGGKFSIHPLLGTIRTQKPLDHETQPVVVLTVQAQLGSSPVCSSTEVNITVMDVNDNHPVFPRISDEIRLSQTTRPGTALYRVHAEDKDSGPNGFIRYSLAGQQPSIFSIDSGLGVVYLNGSLGAGGPQRHTITLMAQDFGVPPLAALFVLTVLIEKQEPFSPLTFESLVYHTEVSESLSLMTQVLRVQAHFLGPQHTTSKLQYLLETGTNSAAFGIHPDTGWIYLRRQLDFESAQTYRFRAFARIPEDRLLQNVSTSVIVHVLDENDNSPVFLHDVLFLKVKESPLPQGVIGKITAIDRDSGKNGQLSYFLLSDGKFFRMNPITGELVSWVGLDHEHQEHHQVSILVTDHGSPPRNATLMAYIAVMDINDNPPYFPQCRPGQQLHVKVLEGQPVNMLVTTVFAKDLDEGNNAEVIYSLSSENSSDHFRIDANSGEIRTTTVLVFDERPSYRITVLASDQGLPPLQGQALIIIQVIPLSKGRAVTSQNIRHLVIPENLKPTKVMNLLKSSDSLHHHYNRKLHFSIAAEDKDGHFEIDHLTGDLFLSKELDYEMASHHLFRVLTKDHSKNPPLSSTVFLSIDVDDQNDHSPSFQDEFIVISIEENVPVGTLVHVFNAKDGDGSFLNSRIQYFIESHHAGMNPFLIHPSFGTLVTASPLDRELVPTIALTVTASDQAVNVTDRRQKSLMAKVVILDVNDHSPTFTSFPIIHIKEDAIVGSLVHHIIAQDPDEGRNGRVTYSIISGNEDRTFLLDASSGFLTIACPLDYEERTQHVLTLLAVDDGTPTFSSSQTLTITVLDVNDEVPILKQHQYKATVHENRNPGEFVTRVEATDKDSGINAKLQFEIMPGASFGLFQINPDTGEVVTTTTLDREAQEVFTLQVLVRDGGVPSLSATAMILCSVDDDNDHPPNIITLIHDIEVMENQEPGLVYTVWATDKDAGNNGVVRFQIIDGNTEESFAINETSGELSTIHALDREQVNSFTLAILCSDLGDPPQSSRMQLHVRVLDDNDHSPTFPLLQYQSSVREDTEVGTAVLVLSAADQDEGLNGQIEYLLMDDKASGPFTLDPVAGVLKIVHVLDREVTSHHTFRVVARDCSVKGSRSTTAMIKIQVTDVNDNDPVWEQNLSEIFLSPQSPINQTIAILRASDPDLGPNGTVTFSFAETQSMFSLNEYTGDIQLQQNSPSEYFPVWLQLNIMDQGVPARLTTGVLAVHMEGEDAKISFSHHLYKGTVMENCEEGTAIVTVHAFTPDFILDDIKYSIFSGNEDGAFSLCSNSGALTVKEPKFLDFEVRNEIQLIILAESRGHRAYSKVVVLIQDVNDNFPGFKQSVYRVSVPEGQLSNTYIIQVLATDLDSGLNGLIEYSILSGNQGEVFQMDMLSGVVTANKTLDYEFISSYSLVVQATDKGMPRLSGTSVIKIQVTDINDNAPAFLPSEPVEIAENSLLGTIVTQISVHDVDLNPAFIFSLDKENNPGSKFAIDQNTGVVILVKTLDFEEVTEYELLIHISDSMYHTEGTLIIHVLDVNDNPPVFSQDSYQAVVPETMPLGFPVLTVTATDFESSKNISYRILSSSKEFTIDPKNGTIFTINPMLLLDKKSPIRFLVEASDGGTPDLSALTLVEISLKEVNCHIPKFAAQSYNLSVNEDTPPGGTLMAFSTLETHENSLVEYSILSGNTQNHFFLETRSIHSYYPSKQVGYLVLLHSLDREAKASHRLVLLATNAGCPALSSTAVVSIEVLDANDNPPQFSRVKYHAHIRESTPPGSPITVVSAEDHDLGPHAEIRYGLVSGNEGGYFHLEERTGILYLMKPLDYEEIIKFTLLVQAADGGKQHLSFAVVLISVLDDNDHIPQFMFSRLTCVVPENQAVSSTLCSVNAFDFDAGPYGELTYSILSPCSLTPGLPHEHHPFIIDPLTGDIHTQQVLDYESVNEYCLMIQAKDKGASTASLMVWVDVEGIDEFEPMFTQDQYFFNLPEKNQGRQLVGRVEASDADAGIDGVVLYSLETSSPFFSVNKSSGSIYLARPLPLIKSHISQGNSIEIKIIAHSPKADSKFASCTVFVNVSFAPERKYLAVSTSSFSISLAISFLVFLFLIFTLIILALRHRQKESTNQCEKEKSSSSLNDSLRSTQEASMHTAFLKTKDSRTEPMLLTSPPEWLSLLSLVEKDIEHLYLHSNSSGHCSVEETAEDKEIQQINEHPYRKESGSALSDRESRVPDSGIPRDSDQLSCLSGETDVVATADRVDSSQIYEEGDGGEGCRTASVPNNGLVQTLRKKEVRESLLADILKEAVFISGEQETPCAQISTRSTADHIIRNGSHWDYLLSWEPKFQPLAPVFNDLAKLRDEHLCLPGIPLEKKSFVFPPPLITAVAQPGIKAVPPRMPAITSLQQTPHSPILYRLSSLPEAMTPSFSPSLSLLTAQTPAPTALLLDRELLATQRPGPFCDLKAEDEVHI